MTLSAMITGNLIFLQLGQRSPATAASSSLMSTSDIVESDSILCDLSLLSISTILKRKALLLHDKYQHGDPLTSRHRKIMSNGLSCILDLVDEAYASQRKLFTSTEWQKICKVFKDKHRSSRSCP
ncbi:hypothetical protein DM01DRAFT_1384216 [Hesseltinella vesiculosa]|uniref:Uncharacterized protein n=1 Tax=Hesseltinella vesiculosa TaxID=101127 RepID=A0A1X2GFH6_9FUNG|nr:hypothetical protein DM01DRAFT_1384216 [Hesseltinella vesiculosa]